MRPGVCSHAHAMDRSRSAAWPLRRCSRRLRVFRGSGSWPKVKWPFGDASLALSFIHRSKAATESGGCSVRSGFAIRILILISSLVAFIILQFPFTSLVRTVHLPPSPLLRQHAPRPPHRLAQHAYRRPSLSLLLRQVACLCRQVSSRFAVARGPGSSDTGADAGAREHAACQPDRIAASRLPGSVGSCSQGGDGRYLEATRRRRRRRARPSSGRGPRRLPTAPGRARTGQGRVHERGRILEAAVARHGGSVRRQRNEQLHLLGCSNTPAATAKKEKSDDAASENANEPEIDQEWWSGRARKHQRQATAPKPEVKAKRKVASTPNPPPAAASDPVASSASNSATVLPDPIPVRSAASSSSTSTRASDAAPSSLPHPTPAAPLHSALLPQSKSQSQLQPGLYQPSTTTRSLARTLERRR